MEPLVTFADLFPHGISRYAIGGALIGLGTAAIYLGTAIPAGASTFLESTLSYVSNVPRFNRAKYVASRDWRVAFTLSIVAGAAIYALAFGDFGWTTAVSWPRLLVGGFLVGVGTRIGKGCTSGHGISGVGSVAPTSLVNVVTFLAVAIVTAQLLQAAGVTP